MQVPIFSADTNLPPQSTRLQKPAYSVGARTEKGVTMNFKEIEILKRSRPGGNNTKACLRSCKSVSEPCECGINNTCLRHQMVAPLSSSEAFVKTVSALSNKCQSVRRRPVDFLQTISCPRPLVRNCELQGFLLNRHNPLSQSQNATNVSRLNTSYVKNSCTSAPARATRSRP